MKESEITIGTEVECYLGIGTINNIWTYKNKKYLSLKINEPTYYQFSIEEALEIFKINKNINKTSKIDIRDNWERKIQCEDGHYVRSLSEALIDNWLYNNNYIHSYEKMVFCKSNPNSIILSDFYIPNGNVYIEFWGLKDNKEYQKRKEEKIKLYEKNNINRIDLYEEDIHRINDILPKLLAKYIKN